MSPSTAQILFALFVWWVSTGAIIYLNNLPRRTHRWSMLGATILLAISLHGLRGIGPDTGIGAAYLGFTYGVLIWGWHEMSFFMGFITGPGAVPCPTGKSEWGRFTHGVRACLYHELAIIATAAAVIAASWGQPNQVGLWTFVVLWVMRQVAKLNVFLGVRNLNEEFVPEHLAFVRSLLRKRRMNALWPASVIVPTLVCAMLANRIAAADPFTAAGLVCVNTMLVLAVLEHWLMILPLPFAALWRLFLRARGHALSDRWIAPFPDLSPLPLPVRPTPSTGADR